MYKMVRPAVVLVAFAALSAGCKKDEETGEAQAAPIEVSPVPADQGGVLRYPDEAAADGKATTKAVTEARKEADTSSEILAFLDPGTPVERKVSRGELVLVSWQAGAGEPSLGWVESASLAEEAEEPTIIPPTPAEEAEAAEGPDAGPAADAGEPEEAAETPAAAADAGKADTDAAAPAIEDAGAPADKAKPAVADAGKAEGAATDAGKVAETPSATGDAGAQDGGSGFVKLPVQRRIPILKLPEVKKKEP